MHRQPARLRFDLVSTAIHFISIRFQSRCRSIVVVVGVGVGVGVVAGGVVGVVVGVVVVVAVGVVVGGGVKQLS